MLTFSEPKESEKEKNKKEGIGTFYNLPQYMKLYEVLKGAYSNYKVQVFFGPNSLVNFMLDATCEGYTYLHQWLMKAF